MAQPVLPIKRYMAQNVEGFPAGYLANVAVLPTGDWIDVTDMTDLEMAQLHQSLTVPQEPGPTE